MTELGNPIAERPALAARLRKARLDMTGAPSQDKLASMLGIGQGTYKQYESGRTPLPLSLAAKLAELTGKNRYWFIDETAPEFPSSESHESDLVTNVRHAKDTKPNYTNAKDLPVWFTAEAGEGAFTMDTGNAVDTVRRPSGLANTRNAYAIYVEGTSMEPAHDAGDLLYVDPNRKAKVGRDCVVMLRKRDDGDEPRYLLKRLVRRTPTKWVFKQFNPEREIHLEDSRVEAVHLVLKNHEINI